MEKEGRYFVIIVIVIIVFVIFLFINILRHPTDVGEGGALFCESTSSSSLFLSLSLSWLSLSSSWSSTSYASRQTSWIIVIVIIVVIIVIVIIVRLVIILFLSSTSSWSSTMLIQHLMLPDSLPMEKEGHSSVRHYHHHCHICGNLCDHHHRWIAH